MKVLITGATGLIGRATMLRLLSEGGHDVTAVSRNPGRAANQLGAEVRIVGWECEADLVSALEGCDLVLHMAGAPVADKRWTRRNRQAIWDSRVGTTQRLVQAMGQCRTAPRVLIQASAVGIYGGEHRPVDETSTLGQGFLADLGRAWESCGCCGLRVWNTCSCSTFWGRARTLWCVRNHDACVSIEMRARIGSGQQGNAVGSPWRMPWRCS